MRSDVARAPVVDDEVLLAEIADGDIRPLHERMIRRRDERHLVREHLHPVQFVKRRLVLDEADVHFAIHDLPRDLRQPAALDADLDVRELLQVVAQRRRQQVHRRRLVRGDRQPAGLERPQLRHLPQRVVAHGQQPPGVVGEHAARFGQRHFVDVAREQRRADFFFEPPHALADRRLRPVHAFGRARERAFFDDGEEVLEMQEVHDFTLQSTP